MSPLSPMLLLQLLQLLLLLLMMMMSVTACSTLTFANCNDCTDENPATGKARCKSCRDGFALKDDDSTCTSRFSRLFLNTVRRENATLEKAGPKID